MYALASLGAPPLLRGRRGTMCTAKGSDVRPGVPWGSAAFAWQAWDNVPSLHFTSLRFTSLHFASLRFASLRFASLHFASLRFASLHFTSLHFTSLHFTSLHFTSHTHTHHTHITHSHSHSLTVHEHTYIHTNSPTITAPSLLYFLFPSCFSMVSLSLKKLVTCGVIRSFSCFS